MHNFRLGISLAVLISVLLMPLSCAKQEADKAFIQIKGSDTEVNLVQRLAEAFMEINPDASLAVTGGGSGTGIAALINQQTHIANSSRPMKQEEIEQAKAKGVEPTGTVFALDGLAVIVHQSLSIDSLSLEDLAVIFRGKLTNWNGVAGADMAISLYGRQSNSGTYVYFRDNVLKGDYSSHVRQMNGNAQIVEAVRSDKAGISYVGVGYVVNEKGEIISGIKVLNIARDANTPAVSPLKPENVKSGLYPLTRPLYQYTDGKPKQGILKFIQFELSQEGQALVEKNGFYPVTPEYMEENRGLGIIQ